MEGFFQNVFNALQWGSFYALIALGYSLVYGVLLLINFAHGDIFMVGAYIGFFTATFLLGGYAISFPFQMSSSWIFVVTMVVTMVLTSGVGVTLERVAYRPLRRKGANRLYIVITALMAGLILENGNLAFSGPAGGPFPNSLQKQCIRWPVSP
jgi:branched-chain amino acid transport system permease protein